MCYRAPGPRCNTHAEKRLAAARAAFAKDGSARAAARLKEAEEDYLLTPKGIQEVAQKSPERAEELAHQRQERIAAAKLLEERNSGQKWSSIPLKEMDPGALTQALMEVSYDESIDWGSSSPQDFLRAVNHATFLHRNQTRANRAGFPRTPYIEHPLRNTLRLYRWGVSDGEVLVAEVMHDTVEDCAEGLVPDSGSYSDPSDLRAQAVTKVKGLYGERVGNITLAVSNDILPEGSSRADKVRSYLHHLDVVMDDPQVLQVKVSDYADNAGGLHHNLIPGQEGMVKRMAEKYVRAMPIFKEKLEQNREHLSIASHYEMKRFLFRTEKRLHAILDQLK